MKKKRIASLLIVAPLALLGACSSTPSLVLEANWFNNTSTKTIDKDFFEELEYAVSFEKSASALNGRFSVDYPNGGTYKTTFKAGGIDGKKTYVYETTLKMQVQYTLNGASTELMEDVVTTGVEFLDTTNELKPLSSWREVHASAPLSDSASSAASLDAAYAKFDYKTEIVYDYEEEEATFTITDLSSEAAAASPESEKIDFDGKGLYFDNEQLFPVLRAADLSSSMSLRSIDPTTRTLDKIAVKDGPTAVTLKQTVKIADAEPQEIEFSAYEISLSYDKRNPGATHKFTIAQRGKRDNNVYRNVVLKYEYPIIYSLGTITYRLTTAKFFEKNN